MNQSKLNVYALITIITLLFGISGCEVPTIIYATPNPDEKIIMNMGDRVNFAVKLKQSTSDEVKYRWIVETKQGYSKVYPDNNQFKFSYTANHEASSNHIWIRFEVFEALDSGCGSTVQILDFKKWEVEIIQEEALVWNGNYLIQSNEDINKLQTIIKITGDLNIHTDEIITSQDGLKNLVSINGGLIVSSNAQLTNLEGLCNLESVGAINISHNPKLENIEALGNITTVPNSVFIRGNDALSSLQGLNNISTIGYNLEISDNVALVDFQGLDNLTSVGNWMSIYNNDALTSFKGLENLASVNGISISGNGSLCNDHAQQFCDQLYAAGVLKNEPDSIILNQ